MSNDELLRYIAQHMVTKEDILDMTTRDDLKTLEAKMATKDELKALEAKVATKNELKALEAKVATKDELKALEAKVATKDELKALETSVAVCFKNFEEKMVTKDELRESENMILTEVDRIQERAEEHYTELSTRIRNLENKVVVRSEQSTINLLVEVVSTLKTDVEYLKTKIS